MGQKSLLIFDDNAISSSEDRSTTTRCRDVTYKRRAYANLPRIGGGSVIHPCTGGYCFFQY